MIKIFKRVAYHADYSTKNRYYIQDLQIAIVQSLQNFETSSLFRQ